MRWVQVLRRTWRKWRDDGATRQGAGLAFYALFSLAPLLLIGSLLTDSLFGSFVFVDLQHAQLGAFLPPELVAPTEELVETTSDTGARRSLILASFALLYAPLRGFLQLQATLNEMLGVKSTRGPGVVNMVKRKALAFVSVGGTIALLFVGVLVNGLLLDASHRAAAHVEVAPTLLTLSDRAGSLVLVFAAVAVIFKTLPDVRMSWTPALAGAGVTTVLIAVGREAIAAYLRASTRPAAFGAAGPVVAILLFTYYIAQVLLFGAAFTWVFAEERGEEIEPGPGAVRVVKSRVE